MTKICLLKCNTYRMKNNMKYYYESFFNTKINEKDVFDTLNNEYPTDKDIEKYDLFILTGTKCMDILCADKPKFVNKILHIISQIINKDKCIYGTCFGHQILSHFFGASVKRRCSKNYWEIGIKDFRLNLISKKMYPFQESKSDELTMITVHHDYVDDIKNTSLIPLLKNSNALLITLNKDQKIVSISCQGHFLYDESFLTMHHKDLFDKTLERNNIQDKSLAIDNPVLRNKYVSSQIQFKAFIQHYVIHRKPIQKSIYNTIKNNSFPTKELITGCNLE